MCIRDSARRNDLAIVVISRISGEGEDRKLIKGDFYLSDDEFKLVQTVSEEFHAVGKKVVVLLNIGAPIEVASWRDLIDGILLIWQAGQETGRIVADLLTGVVTPSGKLPITFPKDYLDVPSWNFPGEPKVDPDKVIYEEDIYIGYRYYDTFGVEPAYEFGYGLSYTKFDYGNLKVFLNGEVLEVSYVVTNTGSRIGKEASQVYIKAPKCRIDKPFQELKAFHKARLLNPQESEEVFIEIPLRDLASFDGKEWVLEKGDYEVRVGGSSRDIKLKGVFTLQEERKYAP